MSEYHSGENTIQSKKRFLTWSEGLEKLVIFKEKWGHCDVPRESEKELGEWVHRMRLNFQRWLRNEPESQMTPAMYKALQEIDFVWELPRINRVYPDENRDESDVVAERPRKMDLKTISRRHENKKRVKFSEQLTVPKKASAINSRNAKENKQLDSPEVRDCPDIKEEDDCCSRQENIESTTHANKRKSSAENIAAYPDVVISNGENADRTESPLNSSQQFNPAEYDALYCDEDLDAIDHDSELEGKNETKHHSMPHDFKGRKRQLLGEKHPTFSIASRRGRRRCVGEAKRYCGQHMNYDTNSNSSEVYKSYEIGMRLLDFTKLRKSNSRDHHRNHNARQSGFHSGRVENLVRYGESERSSHARSNGDNGMNLYDYFIPPPYSKDSYRNDSGSERDSRSARGNYNQGIVTSETERHKDFLPPINVTPSEHE